MGIVTKALEWPDVVSSWLWPAADTRAETVEDCTGALDQDGLSSGSITSAVRITGF